MIQEPRSWLAVIRGRKGWLPSLQRLALWPASLFYSTVMRLRNLMYDVGILKQNRVSVPVVVVGNITVGGTGKTPAVEYVARYYRQQQIQVAILSRGYGSDSGRNDEAMVLEANLDDVPHLQGVDRVDLAQRAIEELESELLVLDDGFQHRRLARDLDIVLIDATEPWGFGYTLPRGLLREPRSALRRAHAIILTRTNLVQADDLARLKSEVRKNSTCPVAEAIHAPQGLVNSTGTLQLDGLAGKQVAAFCGLGNSEGFWRTLEKLGCTIIDKKEYPDHFAYQREDVQEIERWAKQLPVDCWLITTQKDWVKLRIDQLGGKPLWALHIALEITQGEEELHSILQQALPSSSQDDSASIATPSTSSLFCKDAYDSATASSV